MKTTMEELAPYMRGWRSYFGFCETPEVLVSLTGWVRRRLRCALWRQWKTVRRRRAALLELGVRPQLAANMAGSGRGPWDLALTKAPQGCSPSRSTGLVWAVHGQSKCRGATRSPWTLSSRITDHIGSHPPEARPAGSDVLARLYRQIAE